MPVGRWTRHFLTGSAAALSIAGLSPALATHSWSGLHWPRATTLTLRLGDNVNSAWDPYLATASVNWTKAVQIDTVALLGLRSPATCYPTYGRIEICNYSYGYNGWLGIANVWTQYGHIAQATVRLNDSYFASATYNTPSWRRFVMCQEIGHTFGLGHQDESHSNVNLGSCMDYTSDPSGTKGTNGTKNNEQPNGHDYDQLNLIYAHNDGWQLTSTRATASNLVTNSVRGQESAGSAAAFAEAGPIDPKKWGRVLAFDRKGRGIIYARSLPGGAEVTTFVLWADPDHR